MNHKPIIRYTLASVALFASLLLLSTSCNGKKKEEVKPSQIYLETATSGAVSNKGAFDVTCNNVEEKKADDQSVELYANLPINVVCSKAGSYIFSFTSAEPIKYTWCLGESCMVESQYKTSGSYMNGTALALQEGSTPLALHITMPQKANTTNKITFKIVNAQTQEVYEATASVRIPF